MPELRMIHPSVGTNTYFKIVVQPTVDIKTWQTADDLYKFIESGDPNFNFGNLSVSLYSMNKVSNNSVDPHQTVIEGYVSNRLSSNDSRSYKNMIIQELKDKLDFNTMTLRSLEEEEARHNQVIGRVEAERAKGVYNEGSSMTLQLMKKDIYEMSGSQIKLRNFIKVDSVFIRALEEGTFC